ncbi:DNA polymerase III subunit gamma and tau [Frondihabitans australicus]|uniref:DNA-directed DNA polymerase n=1 Tax=Frondihabitans australicus TaxID=386892 RepID=A0A495IAV2_9MICO|nr:DNA polymerase III subunit gamma and tau [Frondihabitans australicus]RKR73137.1 DNA polymerase-3 subunit gamma/tau [Frondihabitans australicus]
MVTALYRRYRPENFAELIGQNQVTDPLRTALRTNRVNHAYLFSGPRGCGKTTSARILARCLNCAEGPTDTPCGVCPSCVELSRGGSGSLDVIEIDAASHNGVDDARDLRDRAIFAPARDRYKIFILDEAHMVTPQGFNALLKIVEEPPEHVKFIFATTEPDKVIGTIRSRTHHYPFRLVPPAQMLDYVQQLCESEGVSAAPGVLPLVVRAGGGSVRDTLSLLDQLIAGSDGGEVLYETAVALLGYTHASLLDGVVDALGAHDGAAAFASVDRVIQTGQDPRRFVEDLLERLRDLIVVGATTDGAAAVLRGITPEELEHLSRQSHAFGAAELSRSADVVNRALTEMTGATSPRLHLELMIARVLVPEADESERGALARVERLERRVGVNGSAGSVGSAGPVGGGALGGGAVGSVGPVSGGAATTPAGGALAGATAAPVRAPEQRSTAAPATSAAEAAPAATASSSDPATAAAAWAAHAPSASAGAGQQAVAPASAERSTSSPEPATAAAEQSPAGAEKSGGAAGGSATAGSGAAPAPSAAAGPVSVEQLRDAWPEILEIVEREKLAAWMVVMTATVRAFADEVLTLTFPSANDVELFKKPAGGGEGVSEYLRRAIQQLLGVRVKYIARVERPDDPPVAASAAAVPDVAATPDDAPAANAVATPDAAPATSASAPVAAAAPAAPPAASPATPAPTSAPASAGASASRPAAEPSSAAPSAGRPAPQAAARPAPAGPAPAQPAAPTTSWEVAQIPQSPPPEPDEPEYITEEPPGGAPVYDSEPADAGGAGVAAPAPATSPSSVASPAGPAAAAPPAPVAVTAPPAAPRGNPARGIAPGSRYGEAVVREILGAQFIHEETIAPKVTPQAPPTEGA